MRHKLYNLALAEIVLWSISLVDLIDYAMRGIAFVGAVLTLVMATMKFFEERRIRQKQGKLMDLQIENEYAKRKKETDL